MKMFSGGYAPIRDTIDALLQGSAKFVGQCFYEAQQRLR